MTLRAKRSLVWTGIIIVTAVTAYGIWWRYTFPYGWSHSCDKQLSMALTEYAQAHDGWYPRGEATPEASLSLLYREGLAGPWQLQGKTVPVSKVEAVLARGELFDPDTCGWNYVEGFRSDDDGRLALFCDKVGLGHNGERWNGSHLVWFVNGTSNVVPASEWDSFLEEQRGLRARLPNLRASTREK